MRPRRLRLGIAAASAALVVPAALYLSTAPAAAAATNLLGNPGFETGSLSSWTCDAGTAAVVSSPAHSGSHALAGTPTSSDDAQCTQTVTVQPSTTYTLSGYVEGSYVYLGVNGGTDTWTPSATSWQQLSMTVTTSASQTSLTIHIHGWYAQPVYYADDLSLTGGTGGTGGTSPSASASRSSTPSAGASPTKSASPSPSGTGISTGGSVGKVAPYVDMSNNQEPMLYSAAKAGLKTYTAAFVISSGCSPIWGDTLPVTNDPTMDSDITTAKADGATPIVSFGGAGGTELAMACTTESSLQAAYQSVINHLGVNHIDFDIEGAPLDYTADNNLRFQAIAGLESANPGLVVSVTLPVLPTGLAADGVAFLALAEQDGARIDLINVMAMDYGSSFTGDMGQEAIQAAQSTLTQAKADWPSDTYANIGVTPMIGQNDNSAEVFSEADAQSLVSWADSAHLGRLAFWSVDRDQPCAGSANGLPACSEISQNALDFTKIFDSYSG
ncbi:carbohydrate binding domain-containing protein [Actinospica robiniae]|uniref:carbohydrate binding domain-containing protein n=1 Tax=Actinospica robiniae TaxID=304901 RepID=UPI00040373B7|nr:carbohydrate binding domain-containing protein [Actinospica robiniae]